MVTINHKNKLLAMLLLGALLVFTWSCENRKVPQLSDKEASVYTEKILALYQNALDSATHYISQMDSSLTLEENQALLQKSRRWYKKFEPILITYDHENYKTINAPNLLKIEAEDFTDIKIQKPTSYQVLEELLYGDEPIDNKVLQYNIVFLSSRLPAVSRNHMIVKQTDQHHLAMVRDAIVNVATKGITGFDSPMLANSLQEAIYNYETIEVILTDIYKSAYNNPYLHKTWQDEIAACKATLTKGEFDSFDRYSFIKKHTNKQLALINQTAKDWDVEMKAYALNPKSENLFGKDFFNLAHFSQPDAPVITTERVALGKALFNDGRLSSSGMSCGTCHVQAKAFTDGLAKAVGNDGKPLQRNTPTVKYAAYQRLFFLDGISSSLEAQIINVLENDKEFHVNFEEFGDNIKEDAAYQAAFDTLYNGKITERTLRSAIATYIKSLAPYDSKFDKSIRDEVALEQLEIDGFNIFMGKAACATCHFPPAFNGTVPPKFLETEFENLGTPANASFTAPVLDQDIGAYEPYKIEERRHFFKTPTVRNASVTTPYMHNGVYESIEEVVKFYNFGGGAGMGLDVPYQTLPPDSLNLNDYEIKALVAFMDALTDQEHSQLVQ